ncbi:hypothetical protein EVAR_8901_1 [Eumeta japonica]|uniref:Uncharacterized protein n=1 Tax=Eumeta variegata TaxID=151549 RepID=A0A4C1U066_EUMVA|nr:hypothetical protein EVAR_8901_1 [Eumeta japonica]
MSFNQFCERVEHVGPLGRAEKSEADSAASPDRATQSQAFPCDIIRRTIPKEHITVLENLQYTRVLAGSQAQWGKSRSLNLYSPAELHARPVRPPATAVASNARCGGRAHPDTTRNSSLAQVRDYSSKLYR